MVLSYLLESGERNHSLDQLSQRLLNHAMIPITDLIGKGKNQLTMDKVDLFKIAEYAGEDADATWRIDRDRLMSLVASHPGGEACVCDLTGAFDLSQPTISHHLKVLHDSGLLDREKRGVWVYYRARTEALASLGALIGQTMPPTKGPVAST